MWLPTRSPRWLAVFVALAWQGLAAPAWGQACPPPDMPRSALRELGGGGWLVEDDARRAQLARQLLPCLASPDPELRDTLALTALTTWMRGGLLSVPLAREIGLEALALMARVDAAGFAAPFGALVLAEVARADRLQPLWSPAERSQVLAAATAFVRDNRDYRGFDPVDGWRHAVAHGADLLLQLAANPVLDQAELDLILAAVAAQAAPAQHFYVFGEGERLARPVILVARRGLHTAEAWSAWFGRIALAGRIEAGQTADLAALARQHNAKALLLTLYAALHEGGDAETRDRLLPGLGAALRTLW